MRETNKNLRFLVEIYKMCVNVHWCVRHAIIASCQKRTREDDDDGVEKSAIVWRLSLERFLISK
jgi:hypothetical protein